MTTSDPREQLGQYEVQNVKGLSDKKRKIEGAGSYGTVYKVTVNGVPRIAKQLHHALIDLEVSPDQKKSILQKFCQECLLLSGLDHPNIVEFIGIHFGQKCRDVDISLIMEQLDTDLDKFIEKRPKIPISIKVSILLDVSFGLHYLHSKQPEAIIHRDLTTRNILLTKDLRAKIADLGVSKFFTIESAAQTKCPGTPAYMPPEALRPNPAYGTKLDIFSFGQVSLCVGVQAFAGPFDISNEDCQILSDFASRKELHILQRKVWINKLIGPDACLCETIYLCLQDDPVKRPTAKHISSVMKILSARYPKSSTDLAAVLEGPTATRADMLPETDPEMVKHLQEQLKTAKEAEATIEKQLEMKKGEYKELIEKYGIEKEELNKCREDFDKEKKDHEMARREVEVLNERCINSLQAMGKSLDHVISERNDLSQRLEALKTSSSEASKSETTSTTTWKSFWKKFMKTRTEAVLEQTTDSHLFRRRSATLPRMYTSDSAEPKTTGEDQSVNTSPQMAKPASYDDQQRESDQVEVSQKLPSATDKDLQDALKDKDDQIKLMADENASIMSQKHKQQLDQADQQRQAELEQDTERLKEETDLCKADHTEKAQLVAIEKLSLEEQLDKVNAEFKLKEKQLETMAKEKAVIDQQLGHEKTNTTALTLELDERKRQLESMATQKEDIDNELSRTKANSAALAMEVQKGRQQLETTIADTSRLSDEVLAKTQQVRQYNKQTDSYKAKLEETAARLQEAQRELQKFQEQNTRMEEDHLHHIEVVKAQQESGKLTAKGDLAIAQRETANLKLELREWKTQKMSEGQVSEALRIEIGKMEDKIASAEAKCSLLLDKCDYQFKAIEVLQQTLTDYGIRPPRIDFGKISTSMQNVQAASSQPRPQATPHVSQHPSQYDQRPGYNQPQQGANQYQPIRAVAPSTPNQPFYNMSGQQQRPPLQHNQQVQGLYGSDPTQSLRLSHRSMTAPQAPVQDLGENDACADYMNIPADQIPAQQQNQQPLRRVQEDGSEQFQQHVHVDRFEHDQRQYAQREQRMPGQGARQMIGSSAQGGPPHPQMMGSSAQGGPPHPQMMGSSAQGGPPHPQMMGSSAQGRPSNSPPYSQAPSSSQGRSREREYRGGNVTLTSTGYARGAANYGSGTMVSQAQPHTYVNLNQSQAGGDQMRQVLGAGVRSQNPQLHRARVGSQGAQGPSPQGPYGWSIASVPPKVQKVPGNKHPIAAPRSSRRAVQEQSQPSPPMNQHAYPDQLAQHSQPGQPDQLAHHSQPGQPDQLAQHSQPGQPVQLAQPVQATRPDQPVPRVKEDTNIQENLLLQGIDDDIHQAVEEVQKEDDENEASLSEVPFDPNLVCPLCMKHFRLGELQKYKKHVGKCQGQ